MKIQNIEILHLRIVTYGDDTKTPINFGSLTLSCEGREYILDPAQTYRTYELGETVIQVKLERDGETFPDCPYDLTNVDLYDNNLKAELFIESEEDFELRYMTLFVRGGGHTRCINVVAE